jgi:hypothetical protein
MEYSSAEIVSVNPMTTLALVANWPNANVTQSKVFEETKKGNANLHCAVNAATIPRRVGPQGLGMPGDS